MLQTILPGMQRIICGSAEAVCLLPFQHRFGFTMKAEEQGSVRLLFGKEEIGLPKLFSEEPLHLKHLSRKLSLKKVLLR